MEKIHSVKMRKLSKDIQTLNTMWRSFGKNGDLAELLRIIRRPGWTTIADLMFTQSIVDAMIGQTRNLEGLRSGLLRGSRAVR